MFRGSAVSSRQKVTPSDIKEIYSSQNKQDKKDKKEKKMLTGYLRPESQFLPRLWSLYVMLSHLAG